MAERVRLEICVDSVEACLEAERGGADRVELCAGLIEGGTTPSAGTLEHALAVLRIPVVVLVRPRRGDFLHSDVELETMARDVVNAKRAGAAAVAIGVLRPDATIDRERVRELLRLARPMQLTFHRAFDFVRDPMEAFDALASLGVDRVLTSGGAPTALDGAARIADLVRASRAGRGRTVVLAGGGIRPDGAGRLVERTGVGEVHATAREPVESAMEHRPADLVLDARELPDPWHVARTRASRVQALRAALDGA